MVELTISPRQELRIWLLVWLVDEQIGRVLRFSAVILFCSSPPSVD